MNYKDPRFDAIRKLSFNDMMDYRETSDEAAKLVDEYRAAIDAENKAELLRCYKKTGDWKVKIIRLAKDAPLFAGKSWTIKNS